MQGLKKYAPLGELRAALFSCLLSVEYISHHLDIKMQVALNPYYLASILSSESQTPSSVISSSLKRYSISSLMPLNTFTLEMKNSSISLVTFSAFSRFLASLP